MPGNGEENRRGAKYTEVIAVVRVLPEIVGINNQVLPKSLLDPRMELIAEPRPDGCWEARAYDRINHRVSVGSAGKHQVFIKRGLHDAPVRDAKNGIGLLHVVGNTEPGSGWESLVIPRYKSPRTPTLKAQLPQVMASWR